MDTSTRCETEDTEMSFVLTQRLKLVTESQMQFLNISYCAITSDFSTLLFVWPRNCPSKEELLRADATILDLLDNCRELKELGYYIQNCTLMLMCSALPQIPKTRDGL